LKLSEAPQFHFDADNPASQNDADSWGSATLLITAVKKKFLCGCHMKWGQDTKKIVSQKLNETNGFQRIFKDSWTISLN
jgi:hypothetical protein